MKALPDPEPAPGEIWWKTAEGHAVAIRSERRPLLPYYIVITPTGRVQFAKKEELRPATDEEAEQYRKLRQTTFDARKREREMWQEMQGWGRE